ncbi:hypothetical protein OESDEN_23696 [Oesophagostomum dentatum]|uniref:WAP domain-containing protein n=1 Tax=Oesophagostomum dentatum TaxID=61180 RepID=A0A0B1RVI1_OESDE|nr:hypothetical protein OESDEN_23696 [Oesophagostomum dentatum]
MENYFRNEMQCPTANEMGYTCTHGNGRTPISWCRTNQDCSGASVRLCCDTGCGFKVCASSKGRALDTDVRFIENEHCPPADILGKNCRMHSSRARNWCNSDDECQVWSFLFICICIYNVSNIS